MTKAAIIQSSYIPWKGYFDIIAGVDVFVFLDDVQFTRRDWRTRNRIKFRDGSSGWLTIPIGRPPRDILINQVLFGGNTGWKDEHRRQFEYNYARAPFRAELMDLCARIYGNPAGSLSRFNQDAIQLITGMIGLSKVKFVDSAVLKAPGSKTEKLINALQAVGADHYLSGPSARDYIDETLFARSGIRLEYKAYGPYKEYPQTAGAFDHNVTVLDVIANVGLARCLDYITSG